MALKESSIRRNFILVQPENSLAEGLAKLRERGGDRLWLFFVAIGNNQYAVFGAGELIDLLQRSGAGAGHILFSDILTSDEYQNIIPIVPSYEKMLMSEEYARRKAGRSAARLVVVRENREIAGYFSDSPMGIELLLDLELPPLDLLVRHAVPKMESFSPPRERYANLWFTERREPGAIINKNQALLLHQEVFLLFFIGPYDPHTILENPEAFPDQDGIERAFPEVAGKSVPLDVTFFSMDLDTRADERTQRLYLERGRPTTICYFPVRPLTAGVAKGRVCVFYQNHLLQALSIDASVAPTVQAADQPHVARVEVTFSPDFGNVEKFPERGLWLGINQNLNGSHALNIKDSQSALSCRQEDVQIQNALKQARQGLFEVSFDLKKDDNGNVIVDETTGLPKKLYRFKADNTPTGNPTQRFKDDLCKLADVGSALFHAVFGKPVPAEEAAETENRRNSIKKALVKPCVIQVCRLKDMGDIWPWSLMYDLDLDVEKVTEACDRFHSADESILPYEECIQHCPHRHPVTAEMATNTVICPYGFWGFKHIIEQPVQPGGGKALEELALEISLPAQPVLEMAVESGLLISESRHITNMVGLKFTVLDSKQEIVSAFNSRAAPIPPEPQIVYFFCHGGYDARANPLLSVGNKEKLRPRELDGLLDWHDVHGLVFINGCHTMELAPDDLANIMWPFVQGGAGGIIGTEITVHTYLACSFAETFFNLFLAIGPNGKKKVGEIIQEIRMDLLAKRNPLGLAYTPYCSADLHLVR